MSLPCPGPFTSNLSNLACNVAAFLSAVAFESLQLIGDVRPEEQAWVQAWRGPPMQRPLEPRVRKVLVTGEDWPGRCVYLLHATRVSRDSRHVVTRPVSRRVASRVSVDRVILYGPTVSPVLLTACVLRAVWHLARFRSLAGV